MEDRGEAVLGNTPSPLGDGSHPQEEEVLGKIRPSLGDPENQEEKTTLPLGDPSTLEETSLDPDVQQEAALEKTPSILGEPGTQDETDTFSTCPEPSLGAQVDPEDPSDPPPTSLDSFSTPPHATEASSVIEESEFASALPYFFPGIDFSSLKEPEFRPRLLGQVRFDTYTRGCKWSPDGLCILTLTDDNRLKIFDTPQDNLLNEHDLPAAVTMKEAETVYDYQWYPLMSSDRPETCCLATTSQYQPVHLYDAFDGHLRATYRCFDHLDEMVAARSLSFDPRGEKLFVGLKNEIRIFDVNVPGRECETRKTFAKKRKRDEIGLSGIISCIAFNPEMPEVFALGTYSRHSAVYLEPLKLLCMNEGQQRGGVTHLQFTPDGTKLLVGGRKDREILVWDLRNPGQLFAVLHREVSTNQRIYFDVTSDGRYIVSAATDAQVRIWDLKSEVATSNNTSGDPLLEPLEVFDGLHEDCINGVSLNPWRPIVATCSGQRHFDTLPSDGEDSDCSLKSEPKTLTFKKDYSMKIWDFQRPL